MEEQKFTIHARSKDWETVLAGDRTGLTTPRRHLLLGCGKSREKRLFRPGSLEWSNLVTLDMNPEVQPDVVHDLDTRPWPFADSSFEEIHAYEVIEHLGRQGDWRAFFDFFTEVSRVLEPKGFFMATCPMWNSESAFSDPGHTRVITPVTLAFLDQQEYVNQVDKNGGPMTDYRFYYKADLALVVWIPGETGTLRFVLQKR